MIYFFVWIGLFFILATCSPWVDQDSNPDLTRMVQPRQPLLLLSTRVETQEDKLNRFRDKSQVFGEPDRNIGISWEGNEPKLKL